MGVKIKDTKRSLRVIRYPWDLSQSRCVRYWFLHKSEGRRAACFLYQVAGMAIASRF